MTVEDERTRSFMKSLGFPELQVHHPVSHFDFTRKGRTILIIGPMGSGKTGLAARVYRDSRVALKKSDRVRELTTDNGADRRKVFYIRSGMDRKRFMDYPPNCLAYRDGYVEVGSDIATVDDSFQLEEVLSAHPGTGTWIVDEAEFFDERIAYVVEQAGRASGLVFIFPMLVLNFRKELFNRTARLILEKSTDVFPLTAYCEHPDCLNDSYYTYRYYRVDGVECPALFFDPLVMVGGDQPSTDPLVPNYETRCDRHHYLPGKEYTYMVLKPLGEMACAGNAAPLLRELKRIRFDIRRSELYGQLTAQYIESGTPMPIMMDALRPPCIAEKALIYLFSEENLLGETQVRDLAREIQANTGYLDGRLAENRRSCARKRF
ncbi:MAG: thymidine kinase [Spirochaetota bacterium]